MNRTTIMLPADLKARAARLAREQGVSLGELIRETLRATLKRAAARADKDPLFADSEVWEGRAPKNLARDHDRYLYGEKNR